MLILTALAIAFGLLSKFVGSVGQGFGGRGTESSSTPVLGDAVRIPATSSHPALRLQADQVRRVATTKPDYPLQRGEHLVAVRFTIWNEGARLWGASSPYVSFSALSSNGGHARRGAYSAVPAKRLMPAAFNLAPGKSRRGIVVFSVPDGAKLVRVSVRMGFGSGDGAEWLVP